MSSQEAVHVSLIEGNAKIGQRDTGYLVVPYVSAVGRKQGRPKPSQEMELSCEQTIGQSGRMRTSA